MICVGSIDELEKLSGVRVTDLHKHIRRPGRVHARTASATAAPPRCSTAGSSRASMPYGQKHYPFENKKCVRRQFPRRLHRRGARSDARLVLLPARPLDGALRQARVQERRRQRHGARRRRQEDVEAPEELPRSRATSSTRSAPIRCAPTSSTRPSCAPSRFASARAGLKEIVRTVVLPYWNALSFFTTYAIVDGFHPGEKRERPVGAARRSSIASSSRASKAWCATSTARWRATGSTTSCRASCGSSTCSPTGTSAARAAASGRATTTPTRPTPTRRSTKCSSPSPR